MRRLPYLIAVLLALVVGAPEGQAETNSASGATFGIDAGYRMPSEGELKEFNGTTLGMRGGYFWKGKFELQGGFRYFQKKRNVSVDFSQAIDVGFPITVEDIDPVQLEVENFDFWLGGAYHFYTAHRYSFFGGAGLVLRHWTDSALLKVIGTPETTTEESGTIGGAYGTVGVAFRLEERFSGLFELTYTGAFEDYDFGVLGKFGAGDFTPTLAFRYTM